MTAGSISPFPLVRKGDQNHPVKTLQYLLRARGHTVTVDGIFGPNTDAAVRAFQRQKGLAVDGIVGPNTWAALIVTVSRAAGGGARGAGGVSVPQPVRRPDRGCRSTGPRPQDRRRRPGLPAGPASGHPVGHGRRHRWSGHRQEALVSGMLSFQNPPAGE